MKTYSVAVAGKAGTRYVSVQADDVSEALDEAREQVGDPEAVYSSHEWRY